MSRRIPRKQYYVVERKKDGKRWRRCQGSTGTREDATKFLDAMRRNFGGRYDYARKAEWV